MKLIKSLLAISLFANLLVYAGPAFDKAIQPPGLTERKKTYVARVKTLGIWLLGRLLSIKSSKLLVSAQGSDLSVDLSSLDELIKDSIIQEGQDPLVVNAIREIEQRLTYIDRALYPGKEYEFNIVKDYYLDLGKAINKWIGTDQKRRELFGFLFFPDFNNAQQIKY